MEMKIYYVYDSDWAGDVDERKLTTGYILVLQGGAVTWNCKKQQTVALSAAEAQHVVLPAICQEAEALWLHNFIVEFGIATQILTIFCDSRSVIKIT